MAEICPYIDSCVLYRNWVEQTQDDRINVIFNSGGRYKCLVHDAYDDPCSEGGIILGDEVRRRLRRGDLRVQKNVGLESSCSHITMLNFLEDIKNGRK